MTENLYPIHNHLDSEPCTEKCPGFRSNFECPLCAIPKTEALLYEDDKIYMVSTKDTKGHKVRIMVATKRHTTEPTFEEQLTADAVLINRMTNLMNGQDWFIVDSKHASVLNHWHRIACSAPIEDNEDPLFEDTPKVHFPLKKEKVLIGVPVYNEISTLQSIVVEAQKHGDVLIVDDGSTDNSRQIAFKNLTYLITHRRNQGYGNSIQDIFKFAKEKGYDSVITIDSDGQHNPSKIPEFIKELKIADVVIGNRFMASRNSDIRMPTYRKFGVKTISSLSGVKDAQCGFRAYNKKAINIITNNIFEKGMGVSVEILRVAQSNNLKINEIPCTIEYEKTQHSQNPLTHGFDVIRAFFWAMIWDKPTKSLLPLGLIFLITTITAGAQTTGLYVQFHTIVLSWALLTIGSLICTMLIFNIFTLILVFKNKKVRENE